MSKLLQTALDQALLLPEEQRDAAGLALLDYIDQMQAMRPTPKQAEEVRKRLAEPGGRTLSVSAVRRRLRKRGA